jgi:hypothetical protein
VNDMVWWNGFQPLLTRPNPLSMKQWVPETLSTAWGGGGGGNFPFGLTIQRPFFSDTAWPEDRVKWPPTKNGKGFIQEMHESL